MELSEILDENHKFKTIYSQLSKNYKTNLFVGSQPIQMLKNDIPRLLDENVHVTPKIDGVRYHMVITSGIVAFIGRDNIWRMFNNIEEIRFPTEKVETFIFDVEVYTKNGIFQVFIFDYLAFQIGNGKFRIFSFRMTI